MPKGKNEPAQDFAEFEQQADQDDETGDTHGDNDDQDGDEGEAGDDEPEQQDGEEGDDQDGEEGDEPEQRRPGKKPSERIKELNRKLRESERGRQADRADFESRFADLEKRLQGGAGGGNSDDERKAPDPNDTEKYPLGVLDDKYVEDKIAWAVEQQTSKAISASIQRQDQAEQAAQAEREITALREKADELADKGSELHEDYDEIVVEAGLRGDYDLTQVTFEACAEADHGAQILYDLANDPKEAKRVASLSPFQQLKFVQEKNAELAGAGRKLPRAGSPPARQPTGSGRRGSVSASTTDFEAFERMANGANKN